LSVKHAAPRHRVELHRGLGRPEHALIWSYIKWT